MPYGRCPSLPHVDVVNLHVLILIPNGAGTMVQRVFRPFSPQWIRNQSLPFLNTSLLYARYPFKCSSFLQQGRFKIQRPLSYVLRKLVLQERRIQ